MTTPTTPPPPGPSTPSAPPSPPPPTPAPTNTPPPPGPWPPDGTTVAVRSLSKRLGTVIAVSDVSFAIGPGVTALLGPNGAGKSTLLRLLCGLIAPSTGQVSVAGGNPRADRHTRGEIGLVPQQDGVFERELALDVVTLAAVLSQVPQPEERARQALATVELDPDLDRPLGAFSKGMRQRVKIAQAIVHDPPVVLLDEPLNGLDPRQRRQMIDLFQRLGAAGRTVLVSSHILEEVERFGSRVLVMAQGRLAAQGDFHAIRDLMDDQPLRIRVRCQWARRVAAVLLDEGHIAGCTVTGDDELEITTLDVRTFRRALVAACQTHNARLEEVAPLDDDLESVFRYLIGTR